MKKLILSIIAGCSAFSLLQSANAYVMLKNDTGRTIFISEPGARGGERLFDGESCQFNDGPFNVKVKRVFFHRGYRHVRLATACTITPRPSDGVMTHVRVVDIRPNSCFSYYPW